MYSSFTYTFSHFNIKHSIVYDPFQHYIVYTFTVVLCRRIHLFYTRKSDLFLMTENFLAFFSFSELHFLQIL